MATKRWKKWLLWFLVLTPVCYAAAIYWRIVNQSGHDESRAADAIVVFGAAEYDGRPSPVFRARLDHTRILYERGIAPLIVTLGGSESGDAHSEGEVGRDYLIGGGVPDSAIIAETHSRSTSES